VGGTGREVREGKGGRGEGMEAEGKDRAPKLLLNLRALLRHCWLLLLFSLFTFTVFNSCFKFYINMNMNMNITILM